MNEIPHHRPPTHGKNPESVSKPRFRWRRLFQFRLRTLVALLVVSALAMGAARWRMEQYAFREELTRTIREKANHVGTHPGTPRVLAWFADPAKFRDVVHLSLHGVRNVDDRDLALLRFMPRLQRLSLHGARISDAGASHLAELQSLTALSLKSTPITDETVARLRSLTGLELLQLSNCRDIGPKLAELHPLRRLRTFEIYGANASDEHLAWLGECRDMERLDMLQTHVRDPSAMLDGMDHLRWLGVGGWSLERLSLDNKPQLRELQIAARGAALHLRDLPRLTQLVYRSPMELRGQRSDGRAFDVRELVLENLPQVTRLSLPYVHRGRVASLPKLTELSMSWGAPASSDPSPGERLVLADLPALAILRLDSPSAVLPKSIASLSGLRSLDFRAPEDLSQPLDLSPLEGLQQLRTVSLTGVRLDRRGLASLPRSLRVLWLQECRLSEDALSGLADLNQVRELKMRRPDFPPRALAPLQGLGLQRLAVWDPPSAMAGLPEMPQLVALQLRDQLAGRRLVRLAPIAAFQSLRELQLTHVAVELEDVREIAALPELEHLELLQPQFPWDLERCGALQQARRLRSLSLAYQQADPELGRQFRELLLQDRDPSAFQLQLRAETPDGSDAPWSFRKSGSSF